MHVFPQFERLVWLHDRIKDRRFPNAARLAERFEISVKTAQRDIDHLRDRLNAPLSYDFARKGYLYTNDMYELPALPGSQQEVLCLLIARNLLSHAAGGYISRELRSLCEKLLSAGLRIGLSVETIAGTFSAVWSGHAPAPEEIFRVTAGALLNRRLIRFTYHSPGSNKTTLRTVEPHHLQHYMASWVLIAWCRERNDFRKFFLARMTAPTALDTSFDPRPEAQWRPFLEGAYGLFQGGDATPVVLRFTPFRARWIREQHWHPDQVLTEHPDGGLDLTLPVADFREIKMKILQFGADCEVISPDTLRNEIEGEIGKMRAVYQKK